MPAPPPRVESNDPAPLRWLASPRLALAALLLGLSSRVGYFGFQDLWYDETFSYATSILPWDELVRKTAEDVHPPLYYFLLRPFALAFGDHAMGLRLPSLILGVVGAIILWDALRRAFGAATAGFGALLVAASSNHQYYCGEARSYALVQLCFAAAIWSIAAMPSLRESPTGWRASRWRQAALWGTWTLALLAGLFTHNLFALAGPFIVGATTLVRTEGKFRHWKRAIAPVGLGAFAGALFVPWLFVALKQVGAMGEALEWMPRPAARDALAALAGMPHLMSPQPAFVPWMMPYAGLSAAALLFGSFAARRTFSGGVRGAIAACLVALLAWYGAAHAISWLMVRVVFAPRFAALAWVPAVFCSAPLFFAALAFPFAARRGVARYAVGALVLPGVAALLLLPVGEQWTNLRNVTRPQTRRTLLKLLEEPNPPEVFYYFCDDEVVAPTFVFHGESLAADGAVFPSPRLLDELSWGPGTGEGVDAVPGEAPADILAIVFDHSSPDNLTIKRFNKLLATMRDLRVVDRQLGGWRVVRAKR